MFKKKIMSWRLIGWGTILDGDEVLSGDGEGEGD